MPEEKARCTESVANLDKGWYIGVRDQNLSTVTTIEGPQKLTLQAHQNFAFFPPRPYVKLGPGQYCDVKNPVMKADGSDGIIIVKDEFGQAVLKIGYEERRKGPDSFPVYHGEEVGTVKDEHVLNIRQALHLQAKIDFLDMFEGQEIQRHAGDEWLVKGNCNYIPSIETKTIGIKNVAVVPDDKYAIILNPIDPTTRRNRSGKYKIVSGSEEFFLEPGEELVNSEEVDNFWSKHRLGSFDGIYVQALETFMETIPVKGIPTEIERIEGTSWTVRGPLTYVPDNRVRVKDEPVKAITMGAGEGVYIKNLKEPDPKKSIRLASGSDQSHIILEPWEELWEKRLPKVTELTIGMGSLSFSRFDKDESYTQQVNEKAKAFLRSEKQQWRAIVLRVPNNAIAEITDYPTGKTRYIHGFDMTMLEPWEEVTILELSGGTPKRPKELLVAYKTLGPDFMHDVVSVSTKDHAKVDVVLSYKWEFPEAHDSKNHEATKKIFGMLDCIGYATDEIAAIIREVAAGYTFDEFHSKAAEIIKNAVLGDQKVYTLKQNGMEIIGIDVKEVNPVDAKIAENLKEAVKTNISIELDAKKAAAQARAKEKAIEDQIRLDSATHLQVMQNEEKKKEFLALQAENEMAEKTAQAKADAAAKRIETDAEAKHLNAINEVEKQRLEDLAAILTPTGVVKIEEAKAMALGLSGSGGKTIIVPHGASLNVHHHEGEAKENEEEF
ncbi:MAG: hypothetical protein ACD_58C00010G0005 [uncultured bacterium]|nr:MAG: hypothetical protein ACD_58C00010G0005 [uncultured bacterium]